MTIASFCHEQLLSGPLAPEDLAARAVAAGLTRSRNPVAAVNAAVRPSELQLLDGRWATPLQLFDGRCLTTRALPSRRSPYSEPDRDVGLLGPTAYGLGAGYEEPDEGALVCLRVEDGGLTLTTIGEPDRSGLPALADRLRLLTRPFQDHGDRDLVRAALRAVAQLAADDPTVFRRPLPPLSDWVPDLLEAARHEEEAMRAMQDWEDQQRRCLQVRLDDCRVIEHEIAAGRAGVSVQQWAEDALDDALDRARSQPLATADGRVVVPFTGRWR